MSPLVASCADIPLRNVPPCAGTAWRFRADFEVQSPWGPVPDRMDRVTVSALPPVIAVETPPPTRLVRISWRACGTGLTVAATVLGMVTLATPAVARGQDVLPVSTVGTVSLATRMVQPDPKAGTEGQGRTKPVSSPVKHTPAVVAPTPAVSLPAAMVPPSPPTPTPVMAILMPATTTPAQRATPPAVPAAPTLSTPPIPGPDPRLRSYPTLVVRPGDYLAQDVDYSNLMSNEEFTHWQALDANDIQSLLEKKGSFLAHYQQNGRSAAQIIADAAHAHQVNPRVILATLEKEESLLSYTTTPPYWALQSAMGYAYPDSGGTAGPNSTFAGQVDQGTALLHQLYDEGSAMSFPASKGVDYGRRVIPVDNAATWALMRYTPHTTDTQLRTVGGGNFLFESALHEIDPGPGDRKPVLQG